MKLYDFHTAVLAFTDRVLTAAEPSGADRTFIGWTGVELVDHLVSVNALCANATRQIGPELLGASGGGVLLRQAGESPLAAWRRTGAAFSSAFDPAAVNLDQAMPTPLGRPFHGSVVLTQGTLENLFHAWDLSPLLDTPVEIPAELVTEAACRILEQPALWQEFRDRQMYAAPVASPPDATAQNRLLAYLGRTAQAAGASMT